MSGLALSDLTRRLANIVRLGKVAELDEAAARVRVEYAPGALTAWLPWLTHRAGPDSDWWAPEPGEQVVLLAPSGELAQAVVLPALYQDAHPAPADARTVRRVMFADGTVVEYDREAHHLRADVKGSAEVITETTLTANVGTDLSANVGGNIAADAGGSIAATAAAEINLTAPIIKLNGQTVIAGAVSQSGGNSTFDGDVSATGGVSDSAGSMQEMRDTYNQHGTGAASHPPGDMS